MRCANARSICIPFVFFVLFVVIPPVNHGRMNGNPVSSSYSATRYSYSSSYSIPAEPIECEYEYRCAEYEYDRALRDGRWRSSPRHRASA